MEKLIFEQQNYTKELRMDAVLVEDSPISEDKMSLDLYTIAILKKSTGGFILDSEQIELGEHVILFMAPGQMTKIPKSQLVEGIFLSFEAESLDLFFNDSFFIFRFAFFHDSQKPSFLKLTPAAFDKIYDLGREVRKELRNIQPDSEHFLRSLLYQLFLRLNRSYSEEYQSYSSLISNSYVLKFRKLMEENIRENHQVTHYAKILGISRTYLNQIAQKFLKRTAKQAIQERLLLEAKKDLIFSKKDIAEIANELHFSAPPHFIRFFKQFTSHTPLQYRLDFAQ
ncbi:MAG: helix-turn-helix domain-containing protein [Bacteroidota bacterium]